MLLYIILANTAVGILGVFGAYLTINYFTKSHSRIMFLVSMAAGSMIAVSFFDLLPEAIYKRGDLMSIMQYLVIGFVIFMLIEKTILYYHCHEENCMVHTSVKLIMLGDTVHNFLDGVSIAASFLAGVPVGIFTTLAIVIHEVPQEAGDLGVLIHSGYTKKQALVYNLFSALAAILGGVVAYFALNRFSMYVPYALAITAGGFIYVAAADLLPELHKDSTSKFKILLHNFFFIFGLLIIWLFGKLFAE